MYFQVHQPLRLRKYSYFDIGKSHKYFDSEKNRFIMERVIRKCYHPTNDLLYNLIKKHDSNFKINFSITGVFLDQLEEFSPVTLDSFAKLIDTGNVELFNETYYHSLAFLIGKQEFREQVKMHKRKIFELFGVKPIVFRNTEAMYSNDIAEEVFDMGFKGIVAEGLDHVLDWRSPNHLYKPPNSNMKVLLRNYKLSDDIGFRFSEKSWSEYPLTADKYASWISNNEGECVNLFMDYETFGEHQWHDTGIFEFLNHFPQEVLNYKHLGFAKASELVEKNTAVGEFDVPYISSWADVDRDLSAWLENKMQWQAFEELKRLEGPVKEANDSNILTDWRRLMTSDHFYYMCTKWFADGDVHKYFNHYSTPYDAFLNYMNVLTDLKKRLNFE